MDKTVAILSRTNRGLMPFESALTEAGVKYHLVGRSGFWSQPEVKAVLAYLGCVLYPADWLVAGAIRAPFFPSKFLPKTKILAELKRFKEEHENGSYWAVLVHEPHELVDNKNLQALHDFTTFVHQLSRYKSLPADEALKSVISALRAVEYYSVEEDHSGDNDPVGNLAELTKLAAKHSTIKEFLDYTRRSSAASKSKKGVALSTIHSAKGLEFSTVFMVQCSEGILPHSKSTDLDEERAIYFVGCSRPEHRLVISYTGNPSPFLKKESTCAQ